LAAELRRKIATAVVTWDQSKPELAGFIKMKVSGTFVFEILIAILVAAGIFNTLFVSVMERMREFGIMMALGYGPRRLFGLVMWESFWIALIGLLAGVLITLYPYYYLSTTGIDLTAMMPKGNTEVAGVGIDPVLHARIFVESAVIIGAAVFIATLTSGLYPAWRAGRVVPVDSIKLV
jgi:ABC-type lipoprotein release transport system permease subunit